MKSPLMIATIAACSLLATTSVQADPTAGFTQYSSTYNVQNWTSGCGGFANLGGGEFETWVCSGESRVEMRWANWPNQNTANQFVCDAMFSSDTQDTAIHQIKSNTGGEVIYLQVQSPGTLRNDNGSVFLSGMANQWFHINSIFNPVTGNGYAYINGALQVTRSYPTSDRAWYFKNGTYNNGLPAGHMSTAWFKNITTWVQSGSGSPDFSISASPSSQTVTAGNGTSYTATISALNGFSSSVSLNVSGLPSNASASFNPASVTGSGSSTLTVGTTTSTPAGTYTLTITGVSGSLSHSATVSLVVNPPPDYSLSASPNSLAITQGANGTSTVTVNPANGFTGSVSLSASGLPAGVTASFNPSSTTSTSTLTLTAGSTAATGTATITITGASGSLTHTTTLSLTVNASGSGGNFSGTFEIQNMASSLVLNNQGSLTNGSPITQWQAKTNVNLEWTFIATTNGYYQINSVRSGLDAVVQSASTASGAKIIQWSFGSSGDDQWKPVQNSDGSYTFFNLKSGLVLEDPGSSTSTSTQMDQATSNGGANQHWNLIQM